MRKALYKAEVWVVLPVTLAVLLASMCLPVTCTAETMARNACPECASSAQHPSGLTMTMHVAMGDVPAGHQMPAPTNPAPCNHAQTSNIQASNAGAPVQIASLAAPAIPAPVPVAVVRPAVRVAEAVAAPTGLVLTASQLRI
jgi:hypothetical protein